MHTYASFTLKLFIASALFFGVGPKQGVASPLPAHATRYGCIVKREPPKDVPTLTLYHVIFESKDPMSNSVFHYLVTSMNNPEDPSFYMEPTKTVLPIQLTDFYKSLTKNNALVLSKSRRARMSLGFGYVKKRNLKLDEAIACLVTQQSSTLLLNAKRFDNLGTLMDLTKRNAL